MRKFGLADALGIVGALVAIAWLPGAVDPLTYPKLLVLVAGGLAVAPAVVQRWRAPGRPAGVSLIPAVSAIAIVVWGAISMIATSAPLWGTLMGWWGRGDGLLAWLGASILLVGAITLSRPEVERAVLWLLGGATIVALVGVLQAVGVPILEGAGGQVVGLMGNTNFAAGYFAIMGPLALGRALMTGAVWLRVWGAGLFVVIAALAVLTDAVQGPAALAAGVVATGVAYALLYRGRFRVAGLISAGVLLLLCALALVGSFVRVGPIAGLWSERTFDIRQQYWQAGFNIMNGLPIFGTGPDNFARYVAEYRPESYVELLGPTLRVSAAHNVALQFGAVTGWLGLLLWITLFTSAVILLLVRVVRAPVASIALTASVMGALAAYLVQGMVSIDMLPLLATGWLVAGLAVALSRESVPAASAEQPKTRKAKAATNASPQTAPSASGNVWVVGIGAVLAFGAAILVGAQMSAAGAVQTLASQEQAIAFVESPMTPCPLRVQVAQQVLQQLPPEVAGPAVVSATDLDRRCSPLISFTADLALQSGQLELADEATREGIAYDPLHDLAWALRARYLLAVGDLPGAQEAAAEAQRVQALYPEDARDPALIEGLLNDIALAQEQPG